MWKKRSIVLLVMTLILNVSFALAQCETPTGDPDDGDPPCDLPLDTWVYVLVFAAVVFYACHLYKKQKSLTV